MGMITLKEYSQRIGKDRSIVYQKYQRGGFQTAVKMGRDIWIDEDEPYIDGRIKSGRFVGWRRGFKTTQAYQEEHEHPPNKEE